MVHIGIHRISGAEVLRFYSPGHGKTRCSLELKSDDSNVSVYFDDSPIVDTIAASINEVCRPKLPPVEIYDESGSLIGRAE